MTNKNSDNANIMRLQKYIAASGVASRRRAEELIAEGRVEVNDIPVLEQGTKVDATRDQVRVNGEIIKFRSESITVAVNKPVGIVSTMEDPQGRPTLNDLLGDRYGRLFHIGRLDTDSEGLILMSNDGDLAQTISHPKNEMPKTYVATINGKITAKHISQLKKGLELKDGFTKFDEANVLGVTPNESVVEVILHSGKNRIVRRMFKELGYIVTKLVRVQIGPIRLGELKTGFSRVLGQPEVAALEAYCSRGKKSTPYSLNFKVQQAKKREEQKREEERANSPLSKRGGTGGDGVFNAQ